MKTSFAALSRQRIKNFDKISRMINLSRPLPCRSEQAIFLAKRKGLFLHVIKLFLLEGYGEQSSREKINNINTNSYVLLRSLLGMKLPSKRRSSFVKRLSSKTSVLGKDSPAKGRSSSSKTLTGNKKKRYSGPLYYTHVDPLLRSSSLVIRILYIFFT